MRKIPAQDLDRVIQNVLLYADEKAMRLNEVFFVFLNDSLNVYSCDDYVIITDSCSVDFTIPEFSLTVSDVEALGAWIKKDKKVVHKYDIEIRPKMTGIIFECSETSPEEDSDNIFFSYLPPNEEAWDLAFQLLSEDSIQVPVNEFAIRSERLVKLARLKADKEAPIDIRGVDVNGHLILQFKKGLTIRGAISPVRRDKVKEEFLWDHIAV